jgi:hypothetical protein
MNNERINAAILLTERLMLDPGSLSLSDRHELREIVGDMAGHIRTEGDRAVGIPAQDVCALRAVSANLRAAVAEMTPGPYALDEDVNGRPLSVWVNNPACRSPHPMRWKAGSGPGCEECRCTHVGALADPRDTRGVVVTHNAMPLLLDGLDRLLGARAATKAPSCQDG